MANNVEILITAKDQASAVLNKASGGVKGLSSAFQSVTGVSLGAASAFAAVVAGIKSSIDFTMQYSDAVSNLSRMIGATTQEASRLIQVADDVKISQEQLQNSLKVSITKGYEPTVEGLGKMSDAYNALAPGVERAKFLSDTFGRSGQDMARIMELGSEGIKKMGENAKMILTPGDIQRMKDYYAATDDLGDSMDQLKVTAGLAAVGPLTWLMTKMSEGIIAGQQLGTVIDYFTLKLHDQMFATEGAGGALDAWTQKMQGAAMPVDSWATAWHRGAQALGDAAGAATAAAGPITALEGIDIGIGDKIANDLKKVNWSEAGGAQITNFKASIDEAFGKGLISEETWKNMSGQAYVAAQQVDVAMGTITGDEAAQNISSTLGVSLFKARELANNTKQYIDDIKNKDVKVTVSTYYYSYYNASRSDIEKNAFGGSFKIPAAFGFEGYQMPGNTASGGENVTVTPEGKNQELDLSQSSLRSLATMIRDQILVGAR